jgi:hypothetical protein
MDYILQRLPIGTQSFEIIRSEKFLYVDKTEYALRMIRNNRVAFLSRPRRFGKSLMISTLHELFNGRKDLFEGLYIYDKWDWTSTNPVIRIDWTQIKSTSPEIIDKELMYLLQEYAQHYQVALTAESAEGCFRGIIKALHEKFNRKTVILIDEYDKPITDNLLDKENLNSFIRTVHDFYQVMKGSDDHIQFVFLTGVSKFAGLSVFSALNNITDISLDPDYAAICGYSQQELEVNFDAHINSVAQRMNVSKEKILEQIKYWYDGYSWDGKTFMYNPFSTLNFLEQATFINFWFNTGTPTMLLNIIKDKPQPEILIEKVTTKRNVLEAGYLPAQPTELPLMFQTGYLTIKDIDRDGKYTLAVPNMEVDTAMSQNLLNCYGISTVQETTNLRFRIEENIRNNQTEQLANAFKYLFDVPYQIKGGKESYYHSVLLIALKALGFKIDGEVSTETGRIDAVWRLHNLTVVTEIKRHETKSTETLLKEAMQQIHDKKYYEKYLDDIVLLAVAFSGGEVACEMEKIKR